MGPTHAIPSESRPQLVDTSRVHALATVVQDRYGSDSPAPAAWDDPRFWNVEDPAAARCQFLAVGNAINFRFWSLVDGRVTPAVGTLGGETFRGSMYLWRRLRIAVIRGELSLDASRLAALSAEEFRAAFVDDDGGFPLEPGMSDRVENLRDLGRGLSDRWGGQFVNVLSAAGGSLGAFARLCARFRAFDDPVQKLTMVNAIMLSGSGLASFDSELLPGIDYHLVKQVVRQGLVSPEQSVLNKLANRQLLDADESQTLRRATLDALMQLAERAHVSPAVIDNLYWLNRRVCDEDMPACQHPLGESCPFEAACAKRTEFGLPLELTRYY